MQSRPQITFRQSQIDFLENASMVAMRLKSTWNKNRLWEVNNLAEELKIADQTKQAIEAEKWNKLKKRWNLRQKLQQASQDFRDSKCGQGSRILRV